MKKVTKIFAFAVAICMLFSVTTTTAFAEETITNMTYDEWLAEQENNNTDIEENDLEPVKVTTEEIKYRHRVWNILNVLDLDH